MINILQKIFPRKIIISDGITRCELAKLSLKKLIQLIRGIIVLKKFVFLESRSRLEHKKLIQLGKFVHIGHSCRINARSNSGVNLGDGCKIGDYSVILGSGSLQSTGKGIRIGENCAIGEFSFIGGTGGVDIGNDVIMGQYVSFHALNHNFNLPNKKIREQGFNAKGISIGDNVWVGAKVTFLDGARVGSNCVVAAGALVKDEFPDGVLIAGLPARIIRSLY